MALKVQSEGRSREVARELVGKFGLNSGKCK